MNIRSKPRAYGPLRVRTGTGHPFVLESPTGATIPAGPASDGEILSRSDLLMAAVGACLAISLRMAAEQMKLDAGDVELSVETFIDGDLPRRFNRIDVRVSVPGVPDDATAEALITRAGRICTVSQTLNSEITLELARS